MFRILALHRIVVAVAVLLVVATHHVASATTLTLTATDQGQYMEGDYHDTNGLNYLVGQDGIVYRNFFVFDLSTVPKPIRSANLLLFEPAGNGFVSRRDGETFELHEVTLPASVVTGYHSGYVVFDDLGDGPVYCSHVLTAAEMGSYASVPVNATGIAALNAVDGLFVFGGALVLRDSYPTREYAFGYSGYQLAQLSVELVPEPGSLLLITLAICATQLPHNRNQSNRATSNHKSRRGS